MKLCVLETSATLHMSQKPPETGRMWHFQNQNTSVQFIKVNWHFWTHDMARGRR